jgi:hypothetical protein
MRLVGDFFEKTVARSGRGRKKPSEELRRAVEVAARRSGT